MSCSPLDPPPQSNHFGNTLHRDHVSCGPVVNLMLLCHFVHVVERAGHLLLQAVVDLFQAPIKPTDVLHPLKVGDRHSTRVAQKIGDHVPSICVQDLICLRSGRSVRRFGNDLGFDLGGILFGDYVFNRRGD